MPEGDYPATCRTYRQTWTRPRFASPRSEQGVEVDIPGGVPNGREKYGDWDSTVGFSMARGDLTGWQEWAPAAAAEKLLRGREGYGKADWSPPADARNPRMVEKVP